MSPEHERDLVERYPKLFAGYGAAPDKSAMAFGFECGDGWFDLLDTLCAQLSKLKPARKLISSGVSIAPRSFASFV